MTIKNIAAAAVGLAMCCSLAGCDEEKDLIIIDGDLPIKTSTLYMVGDATPNGWSIDNPTPLTAGEEDPLVFTWEGPLHVGEMKLCLAPGSWDNPFIRPLAGGTLIGTTDISAETFGMHAGDPDNKWKIAADGIYSLTFNLRDWTYSTHYVGELDPVEITPIETENLYMVGSATPNGWNIDEPTPLTKDSQYIFSWEGELTAGELKFCMATGSWDVEFIRPAADGTEIGENGVDPESFVKSTAPDNKWNVTVHGVYKLTLDLEHWTIKAELVRKIETVKTPIETETLFMIGDATPGGWSMDDASEFTRSADNGYIFTWEGTLAEGHLKACIVRDNSFSCPFIRPESADVVIDENGVAAPGFTFTTGPDDQWAVKTAGKYRLTLDLENWTIAAEKLTDDPVEPGIVSETLYLVGDASPGGWSMDDATALTRDASNKYVFTWEGHLVQGNMKACLKPDGSFSCPFIRPAAAGVTVGADGASDSRIVYTTEPDDQWTVVEAGTYRLTFNLLDMTFEAVQTAKDQPVDPGKQPIVSETLYIIGDATPNGWSMDNATALTKTSTYVFTWEGHLNAGNMKACLEPDGTFSCPFIRPSSANVAIDANGVAAPDFVYTTEPDDQWTVREAGTYRLTFDLEKYTIEAVQTAKDQPVDPGKEPLESATLYMIGDATPNGWSMDDATAFTKTGAYEFTWEGNLKTGEMKACLQPDGTFSCPFLRPSSADVKISRSGVEKPDFVYTTAPDDKWKVTAAGKYRLVFDLKNWTITATAL